MVLRSICLIQCLLVTDRHTKGENKLIEKKKQKKLKNKKQRKILRQAQVVKTVMFI